ncbi:MAG: hypothetical protein LQ349_009943, partial [Xanthoria aureola]
YGYLGCYTEGTGGRALSDVANPIAANKVSVEACGIACSQYTYFGVEYSGHCDHLVFRAALNDIEFLKQLQRGSHEFEDLDFFKQLQRGSHEFEDLDHFFNIVNKLVESHQHCKPNIKFDFIQDKHFDNVDIELDKRPNYSA